MARWHQVSTFAIDDGELDDLSPQECFVLGYELAQIDGLLAAGRPINRPVHSTNRARIEERCRAARRRYAIDWMPDDRSESWVHLKVEPA